MSYETDGTIIAQDNSLYQDQIDRAIDDRMLVVITGGNQPYNWRRIHPVQGGNIYDVLVRPEPNVDDSDGFNPAWERNGNRDVPIGSIVFIEPSHKRINEVVTVDDGAVDDEAISTNGIDLPTELTVEEDWTFDFCCPEGRVVLLTTAGAPTTTVTSLTGVAGTALVVGSATAFPGRNNFRIKIGTEVLEVTSGAGTTSWTVTRGVDNTTAGGHAAADVVTLVGAYAWSEQRAPTTGNDLWTTRSPLRSGTQTAEPARERNHNTKVGDLTYALIHRKTVDGAGTTLLNATGDLAIDATSFFVVDASTFPTVVPFAIRIQNEYMLVTAKGTSAGAAFFTVTRGFYDSIATRHEDLSVVVEAICEWTFDRCCSDTDDVCCGLQYVQNLTVRTASFVGETVVVAVAPVTIGGVTMVAGDRALLKNQTTATQNGAYTWVSLGTPMTRVPEMDSDADLEAEFEIHVEEGSENGDSTYSLATDAPRTLGVTALSFRQTAGYRRRGAEQWLQGTIPLNGLPGFPTLEDLLSGVADVDAYGLATRLTATADYTLGGIALGPVATPNANVPGRMLLAMESHDGFVTTILHESAGSVATNRIRTQSGSNFTIGKNTAAMFLYDGTNSRWDLIFPSPIWVTADSVLLGRCQGSAAGYHEQITINASLSMAGCVLGRAALSGDVQAAAGSNNVFVVQASVAFAFTGDITPTTLSANVNDYSPTGLSTASTLRLSSDASRNITGLDGGTDGRIIIVHNVGAFNIVFKDEDAASLAANRFAMASDLTLSTDESGAFQYDSTSLRWRLIAKGLTTSGVGSGDVVGPAVSVDNEVTRFNGITGKLIQGTPGFSTVITDAGAFLHQDGTVLLPSISFANNSDTGFYLDPAFSTVRFTFNGADLYEFTQFGTAIFRSVDRGNYLTAVRLTAGAGDIVYLKAGDGLGGANVGGDVQIIPGKGVGAGANGITRFLDPTGVTTEASINATGNMALFAASLEAARILVVANGQSSTTVSEGMIVNLTYTGTALQTPIGGNFNISYNPGAAPSVPSYITGVDGTGITNQDNGAGVALVVGVQARWGCVNNAVAPVVCAAFNARAPFFLSSPTAPTTSVGLSIETQGVAGVTNAIGVRIKAQTLATNLFSIDQEAITNRNRFAGTIEGTKQNLVLVNGANNNVVLTAGVTHIVTGPTAAFNITGIAGGVDGRIITLINSTVHSMTFVHDSASSTATNRILSTGNAAGDVASTGVVAETIVLQYDTVGGRWRIMHPFQHAARASRSAAQSIPQNTDTKVAFDVTTFARGITSDLGNDRITVTRAGLYRVSGRVAFASGLTNVQCVFYKNGAAFSRKVNGIYTTQFQAVHTDIFDLLRDDYIELFAFHGTVGNQNTSAAGIDECHLTVEEI